jgi:Putative peptidoglycan binding domain
MTYGAQADIEPVTSPEEELDPDGILSLPAVTVYDSFDAAPLDPPPEEEGDNMRITVNGQFDPTEAVRNLAATPPVTNPLPQIAPFVRLLRKGSKGPDVLAVQRAVRAAGFRTAAATGTYGEGTDTAIRRFQKRWKLEVDGIYGRRTHARLAHRFDAYGLELLLKADEEAAPADKIGRAESAAMLLYNKRVWVRYTQGPSRMDGVRNRLRPPAFPRWEDCSSSCTWFAYCGEWDNPNGYSGWPPYGYTGTLVTNGRYSSTKRRGAFGFYGRGWPYSHVVISVGNGDRVVSHGSDSGPYLLPWNYRSDFRMWRTYV